MEGTCLCGAVKVKVTDDELFTKRQGNLCHCLNCRKISGGIFGVNLVIEKSKVAITGEQNLKRYSDPDSLSGIPVQRYFCSTCGVPIKSMTPNYDSQGVMVLKLGIYPKLPQPAHESWVVNRQEWEKPTEGCTQYKAKFGGETL